MNIQKTLCLAAALAFSNAAMVSAEQVKIGMPTWTGAQAIGHLLGTIVEEKIG